MERKRTKITSAIIAALLSIAMVFTLAPIMSFAEAESAEGDAAAVEAEQPDVSESEADQWAEQFDAEEPIEEPAAEEPANVEDADITPQEDVTQYEIRKSSSSGGTFTTNPDKTAMYTQTVTITVMPEEDYECSNVHVYTSYPVSGDVEVTKIDENTYQFSMPNMTTYVTVGFRPTSSIYDFYVGGVKVNKNNAKDILGNGTASFNYDTNTLTLKNANITGMDPESGASIYCMSPDVPFKVILQGTNKLSGAEGGLVIGAEVIIGGSGTLNITSERAAINTMKGLTINSGTINATVTGDSTYSTAISSGGMFFMNGGTVNAKGGNRGLYTDGAQFTGGVFTVENNATSSNSAFRSRSGIAMGDEVELTAPVGGNFFDDGNGFTIVCEADGVTLAHKVVIKTKLQKVVEAGGNDVKFNSYVYGSADDEMGVVYPTRKLVSTAEMLPSAARPYKMQLTAYANKMTIEWNKCDGVDGYVIVKKVRAPGAANPVQWSEVKRITDPNTIKWTDTSATKKNYQYYYLVFGYKKINSETIRISRTGLSCVGVLTGSSKVNPYGANAPVYQNVKNLSKEIDGAKVYYNLANGKSTTMKMKYNNKVFTDWTRWRVNKGTDIVSINSKGVLKSKGKKGEALISARTADGRDVRCMIYVK